MAEGLSTGIHFGLTSGVITTLGLMVGLSSGTHSTAAVVGGILTIAVADAMSDALGIHIAKESERESTTGQIWQATLATFVAKFIMAATFLLPVLLLPLSSAVPVSVGWGLLVVALLSYRLARGQGESPLMVISEHLGIAIAVVLATHFIGVWIAATFGT